MPNRTAAMVKGGVASTAIAPATHVPPKHSAMPVSIRYAARLDPFIDLLEDVVSACADRPADASVKRRSSRIREVSWTACGLLDRGGRCSGISGIASRLGQRRY